MTLKEAMEEYIETLERKQASQADAMWKEATHKIEEILKMDDDESRLHAFKGYEPKFDRQNISLEVRDEIIRDLKSIWKCCD